MGTMLTKRSAIDHTSVLDTSTRRNPHTRGVTPQHCGQMLWFRRIAPSRSTNLQAANSYRSVTSTTPPPPPSSLAAALPLLICDFSWPDHGFSQTSLQTETRRLHPCILASRWEALPRRNTRCYCRWKTSHCV